jgi:hypothetical protein
MALRRCAERGIDGLGERKRRDTPASPRRAADGGQVLIVNLKRWVSDAGHNWDM